MGIAEIIVGFQLIGNLNERNASKETIGYSFNALLMAAGIIVSAMGVIVFIAVSLPHFCWLKYILTCPQSYVYSNSQTHTTARTFRSRAYNSLDKAKALKSVMPLEEVRVIDGSPELERPQRAYSQSSRRAPPRSSAGSSKYAASGGGIGRPGSAASSRGPFPYAASRVPSSVYSQPSSYHVKGNPYV